MDMDYMFCKEESKSRRRRESNWDRNEKKSLLRLVQRYRPVIDNRGNDNVWIRRKNAAWEAIQRGMASEGFRRGVKSVRQQWARMKGEARKKQSKIKREKAHLHRDEADDDNPPILPDSPPDLFSSIVKIEVGDLEEEETSPTVAVGGDSITTPSDDEGQNGLENNLMSVDTILTSIHNPNESSGIASAPPSTTGSATEETSLPPPRPRERKLLPKFPIGRGMLNARLRQIEEETIQKAEMHELEVTHRKQIHALRFKQMRDQIEQQRRLFEAQMRKLHSSN